MEAGWGGAISEPRLYQIVLESHGVKTRKSHIISSFQEARPDTGRTEDALQIGGTVLRHGSFYWSSPILDEQSVFLHDHVASMESMQIQSSVKMQKIGAFSCPRNNTLQQKEVIYGVPVRLWW
jgi:hypothetical protein